MTEGGAGMTEGGAGMTEGGAGMTEGGAGMTEGGAGMTEMGQGFLPRHSRESGNPPAAMAVMKDDRTGNSVQRRHFLPYPNTNARKRDSIAEVHPATPEGTSILSCFRS